ncbi:sigma-70 family RNA polymerase sigma factor [Sphingomonas sp. PP-CE-1G-424]|uniref:RNA polymerase sigma factor n=1 Tax=Sphingomonas sp. PP-CE-1G-424 TaxID=2135658 RepID=UPI0010E96B03|nr:sigma-70 family RNA polymerase sigma factor [Sphingomonas sp. PP-CE-1G-424]TCP65721.1 RNA polymerase sigma-70 factor (ECF subfamily) [Sphingomonas sp. PP-CE-1G-424]
MSKPLAAKGSGACLKHVLYTRLVAGVASRTKVRRCADTVEPAGSQFSQPDGGKALSAGMPHQRALLEGDPLTPDDRVIHAGPSPIDLLYREQRPSLLRFFRRRTSLDDAGDLVQRVFARFAGLSPETRVDIVNPAGYLQRSAANLALDDARTELRRASAHHVPVDEIDPCAPDQIAALEARDMLRRLERALQRLKPRTREIFLAHRIDGYSYVEIARRTGLSVKGVEKHMTQAIAFVDRVLAAR